MPTPGLVPGHDPSAAPGVAGRVGPSYSVSSAPRRKELAHSPAAIFSAFLQDSRCPPRLVHEAIQLCDNHLNHQALLTQERAVVQHCFERCITSDSLQPLKQCVKQARKHLREGLNRSYGARVGVSTANSHGSGWCHGIAAAAATKQQQQEQPPRKQAPPIQQSKKQPRKQQHKLSWSPDQLVHDMAVKVARGLAFNISQGWCTRVCACVQLAWVSL